MTLVLTLILYLTLLAIFIGGLIVIVYHLQTFRLNRTLATIMIAIALIGGLILLIINLFYFFNIDWAETFNLLAI